MPPPELTLEDYKAKYEYFRLKCQRLQEDLAVAKQQLCDLRNNSTKCTDKTTSPESEELFSDYDKRPPPPDVPSKTIRGKKRKQLPGYTCEECSPFYDAAGLGVDAVQQCTRHRGQERPKTPPGFWNVGWISPMKKN